MGCGRVGAALAADLSARRQRRHWSSIPTPARSASCPRTSTARQVVGNGIDLDVLRRYGVDRMDVFVSATRGDNRNVMAAQIAKHIFGVQVVATRVFDPLREEMYRNMGLRTINPTRVQAKRLKKVIDAPTEEAANEIVARVHAAGGRLTHVHHRHRRRVRSAFTSRRSSSKRTTKSSSSSRTARSAKEIADELGDIVMEGDGCEATVLEKAGTSRADMLLAVTGDDEDNLVACQVAKQRFNVARTVARINDPKNEEIFRKLEVDITVSATSAIMAHIEQELPTHHLIPLMRLKGSGLEIVEVRIPEDSRVVGQPVRSIMLPYQSMISLIVGEDGQPKVPSGETIIHAGDEVVAVTHARERGGAARSADGAAARRAASSGRPSARRLPRPRRHEQRGRRARRPPRTPSTCRSPRLLAAARALEAGDADCAVLPIENSLQGSVTDTVDLLVHDEASPSRGEVVLRIEHCLMVQPGATRDADRGHLLAPAIARPVPPLPRNELPPHPHRGRPLERRGRAGDDAHRGAAAIGPARAAEIYGAADPRARHRGLAVNKTRFVVVARESARAHAAATRRRSRSPSRTTAPARSSASCTSSPTARST